MPLVHGRSRREEELKGRPSARSSSVPHRRRTATRLLCGVIFSSLLFTACARTSGQVTPEAESLTIGIPEAIAAADLGLQNLASILTDEGLVQLSPDGRSLPRLAESWSWDNGGLTLRVNLRKDVTLHDGTPLTGQLAADIMTTAVANRGNRMFYTALRDVRDVTATGPLQLSFNLSRYSAFLTEALELPIKSGNPAVGTGPYRVVKQESDEVVLARNDRYYLGRPNIARVVIRPFGALRPAWSSLLRGEVDMVTEVPPDAIEFVKSDDVQVFSFDRRYQFLVAFNSKRAPFNNRIVRRALNAAVDRRALIDNVLQGRGTPSTGPLWPRHWAYDQTLPAFSFDPALAISLLENSGFREHDNREGPPSRLHFTCLIPANFSTIERMALNIQKQLYDVGVEMKFEVVRAEDLDARIRSGMFDALLIEMVGGPTLSRAYMFWGSAKSFQGLNVFGYENPEAERNFDVLRTTTNEGVIRSATRDLQQVLLNDPPALFLTWNQRSRAIRRGFEVVQDSEKDAVDPLPTLWRWTASRPQRVNASR